MPYLRTSIPIRSKNVIVDPVMVATSGSSLMKSDAVQTLIEDLLYANGKFTWFEGKRIDNPNTHGTGCTLTESVQKAKDYISGALAALLDLGNGSGPMDHAFVLRK